MNGTTLLVVSLVLLAFSLVCYFIYAYKLGRLRREYKERITKIERDIEVVDAEIAACHGMYDELEEKRLSKGFRNNRTMHDA